MPTNTSDPINVLLDPLKVTADGTLTSPPTYWNAANSSYTINTTANEVYLEGVAKTKDHISFLISSVGPNVTIQLQDGDGGVMEEIFPRTIDHSSLEHFFYVFNYDVKWRLYFKATDPDMNQITIHPVDTAIPKAKYSRFVRSVLFDFDNLNVNGVTGLGEPMEDVQWPAWNSSGYYELSSSIDTLNFSSFADVGDRVAFRLAGYAGTVQIDLKDSSNNVLRSAVVTAAQIAGGYVFGYQFNASLNWKLDIHAVDFSQGSLNIYPEEWYGFDATNVLSDPANPLTSDEDPSLTTLTADVGSYGRRAGYNPIGADGAQATIQLSQPASGEGRYAAFRVLFYKPS